MSGTVLEHPLVRDYLSNLDAACATLPAAQSRELREQITAHLDEALPPDAADEEVAAELRRLGTPRSLAAEMAGPVPLSMRRRLRTRLSRVRWWAWSLIAAVVAVATAVAVYLTLVLTAEPLQQGGLSGWWSIQDGARAVFTRAGGVTQWTVPERFGQQQGFVVGIYNDSDWTQTIIGPDLSEEAPDWQLSLAVDTSSDADHDVWDSQTHWVLPASIPPHSDGLLRVLWISRMCNPPNSEMFITGLYLRVRVGLITRTEDLQLNGAFALSGTKASSC